VSKLIRKPLLTGMRLVAILEGVKGTLVLLVGFGLLALVHRDIEALAERLVRRTHLDPAGHYPRIFIEAASNVTDARLWLLAAAAGAYSIVRLVEAYGLWYERRWAEWFALVSAGLYIPVEIYELFRHATWIKAVVFISNIAIVVYMAYALKHSADQDKELDDDELAKAHRPRPDR
jgi:uncharacterized membrane protein (DUF2068 family)